MYVVRQERVYVCELQIPQHKAAIQQVRKPHSVSLIAMEGDIYRMHVTLIGRLWSVHIIAKKSCKNMTFY